jgi:hypothetical protein
VHRGGERSLDISADLTELGRTPVAVVCAGAKTVLDIPRTLEVLETQVPVNMAFAGYVVWPVGWIGLEGLRGAAAHARRAVAREPVSARRGPCFGLLCSASARSGRAPNVHSYAAGRATASLLPHAVWHKARWSALSGHIGEPGA